LDVRRGLRATVVGATSIKGFLVTETGWLDDAHYIIMNTQDRCDVCASYKGIVER